MEHYIYNFWCTLLTVVDIFAGAGGTAVGFHKAGFQVIGAVDIDVQANNTYERNIGLRPLDLDLLNVSPQNLRKSLNLKRGKLDVLVGCPPCQGFSRLR